MITCSMVLLCGAPGARAEQADQADKDAAGDPYAAGQACFEQLDFACAVDLLTAAAYATHASDHARRIDIQRKLAESHLALGQRNKAVSAFELLLRIDPRYRIDAPGTSPKILAALEEARSKQKAPAATRRDGTQVQVRQPEAGRSVRIGLAGGAEFLVGGDRRLLEIGPVVDLDLMYQFSENWLLGGGLRWAAHSLADDDSTLHLVGGWAGTGPAFRLGPVLLAGTFGFGVSRFGIPDREGKTALLLPLRLTTDVRLHDMFELGLSFSPSLVLSLGDFRSSLTLDLAARLVLVF